LRYARQALVRFALVPHERRVADAIAAPPCGLS